MKHSEISLFLCFPLLLLLFLSSCKPCDDPTDPACPNYCVDETNPECPNYDPCWDQTEVSAEFEIAEVIGKFQGDTVYFIPSDTVLTGEIRFRADLQADSYEWTVGTDPRVFTEREVSLFFTEPTQLWITLIAKREPNSTCFPSDDGIDTVRRRMVVLPIEETALIGKYQGATTADPDDIYIVEFFKRYRFEDSTVFDRISITNIHPGCDNTKRYDALSGEASYRAFTFYQSGFDLNSMCFTYSFLALLNASGDSLNIRYRRFTPTEPYEMVPETFEFKGVRIE